MKTNEELLSRAIALTADMFVGVYDKSGQPYILHCLHVMNHVPQDDHELMMVAVMHDLLEYTDVEVLDLVDMGFSTRVIDALKLLNHDPNQPYDKYIEDISRNMDATLVKIEDLRHNSDITRMKGLRDKDFVRLEKYHRSYARLTHIVATKK